MKRYHARALAALLAPRPVLEPAAVDAWRRSDERRCPDREGVLRGCRVAQLFWAGYPLEVRIGASPIEGDR